MPDEPEGGVIITVREIYDQLVVVGNELRRFSVHMELGQVREADQEQRLRSLERWKYGLPISLITSMISLIAALSRTSGKAP